jgi:hypothetical protein
MSFRVGFLQKTNKKVQEFNNIQITWHVEAVVQQKMEYQKGVKVMGIVVLEEVVEAEVN